MANDRSSDFIQTSSLEVTVRTDGLHTAPFPFHPAETRKPDPWTAFWIWLDRDRWPELQISRCTTFCDGTGLHHGVALFRRTFELDAPVRTATAWVSADVKYRLLANGRPVARGPAVVGGDYGNRDPLGYWFYDRIDLTAALGRGSNVLAAEVLLQPEVMTDYSMGHGGFLLEVAIEFENGRRMLLSTDGTWKATPNPASIAIDRYDARLAPVGWSEPGFDDSSWPAASPVESAGHSGARWALVPREIPPLAEARIVPIHEDGTSFDFGKVHAGRLWLDIEGDSGTEIVLSTLEVPHRVDRKETLVLREGRQSWESIHMHSVRILRIEASATVRLLGVALHASTYPDSLRGAFSCSDPDLTRIYDAGRWTLQLCRQSCHLDSPIHQEALGCTGDYFIESLMNYMVFGDPWLTRLDLLRTSRLLDLHDGVMFHTSYSLLWLQMLVDHHLHTGDRDLLAQVAPTACRLLERFLGYRGPSGLVDRAPNYMFMDWVPYGDVNLHHPPRTIGQGYLSAFLIQALRNGALLTRTLGDDPRAARFDHAADEIMEAFERDLWCPERGLYRDGRVGGEPALPNEWLPPDLAHETFSQHANALAVLYGIAPKERGPAIMERVFTDPSLIQAQPYFLHFVLEAAAEAGVFGRFGNEQMRRWTKLLEECPGSLKEVWSGFDCDFSHAWGGTPTWQLPSKVLGIAPLRPGFATTLIRPIPGDLSWAKGVVPTPLGDVEVFWELQNGKGALEVTVPPGMEVQTDTSRMEGADVVVTVKTRRVG